MQLPQILTPLAALALTWVFSLPGNAQISAPSKADDAVISEMQQAFRKNDKARLTALLPQARGHVLEPWAAYWELSIRLDRASNSEIQEFLNRYAGSYAEDRLRSEWLQMLGKRRDWATSTRMSGTVVQMTTTAQNACIGLMAKDEKPAGNHWSNLSVRMANHSGTVHPKIRIHKSACIMG